MLQLLLISVSCMRHKFGQCAPTVASWLTIGVVVMIPFIVAVAVDARSFSRCPKLALPRNVTLSILPRNRGFGGRDGSVDVGGSGPGQGSIRR